MSRWNNTRNSVDLEVQRRLQREKDDTTAWQNAIQRMAAEQRARPTAHLRGSSPITVSEERKRGGETSKVSYLELARINEEQAAIIVRQEAELEERAAEREEMRYHIGAVTLAWRTSTDLGPAIIKMDRYRKTLEQ